MRLSVSNIAWDAPEEAEVLALFSEYGVQGVEVAPTKIWPDWAGVTERSIIETRSRFADQGFVIPAFQSILFGKPEFSVFGEKPVIDALVDHVAFVSDIAAGLGAKCLVFGSPKARDPGDLSAEDAKARGAEVFARMGEAAWARSLSIGIEANPEQYGCRFMSRWSEAAEIVRRIGSPGVRLHLDAACTMMAGDDPAAAVPEVLNIMAHAHISEPQLGGFDAPEVDHAAFGKALANVDYQGWVSIEMRRQDDPLPAIRTALNLAKEAYPEAF